MVSPLPPAPNQSSGRAIGAWAVLVLLQVAGPLAGPLAAQQSPQLERYQRRMEAWFQRLDRNRDGRLSPVEVRGNSFLELNFQRLDGDNRGYLIPADLAPSQRHLLGERIRETFQNADRNGNGSLSPAEARAFPWLQKRFAEADRNGDGGVTLMELWDLRRSLAPRR